MKKKKLSPFFQLKNAIETELFDLALELQRHMVDGENINSDFLLGYRSALLVIQAKAFSIEQGIYRDIEFIPAGADSLEKLTAWAESLTKEKGS